MRFQPVNVQKQGVLVLGAGATRGASFVDDEVGVLPPLDGDFYVQAQKATIEGAGELVDKLIEDTVEVFGNNFALTMEDFLTQIEHLSYVFQDYRFQGRPPATNRYEGMRERFLQCLAAVMYEALGREPECEHHKVLLDMLDSGDTIMSFNYDWLMDSTLRKHAGRLWDPRCSYGVPVYSDAGAAYWANRDSLRDTDRPDSYLKLLKMHGSLTWFGKPESNDDRLKLRQRWWHQRGTMNFEIAPPQWNKPIRSGIYQNIWREARKDLIDAEALVFIGYSLPDTDLPAQALFRIDAGEEGEAQALDWLVLVNPDPEARRRIRRVLMNRLNKETRVLVFDRLKQFADWVG